MIYEINFFINNSSFKISNVSPLLLKFNQISPSLSLFPEYSVPPPLSRGTALAGHAAGGRARAFVSACVRIQGRARVRGTLNQAAFVARVERARVRALATTRSAKVYPELFCSGAAAREAEEEEERERESSFLLSFPPLFFSSTSPFLFSASSGDGGARVRRAARAQPRHFCSSSP